MAPPGFFHRAVRPDLAANVLPLLSAAMPRQHRGTVVRRGLNEPKHSAEGARRPTVLSAAERHEMLSYEITLFQVKGPSVEFPVVPLRWDSPIM